VEEELEESNFLLAKLKTKLKDRENTTDSQNDYKNSVIEEYKNKFKNLESKMLNSKYDEMAQ